MSNLIDIKDRINTVDQLRKITHAVQLVTGVNLQKVKQHSSRMASLRKSLSRIVLDMKDSILKTAETSQVNFLMGRKPWRKHLIVVMSCNMGLNGDFNIRLFQGLQEFLTHLSPEESVNILCVGHQLQRLLKQKPEYKKLLCDFGTDKTQSQNNSSQDQASDQETLADLVNQLQTKFQNGDFDRCTILYTHHISTVAREVHALMIVPCLFEVMTMDVSKFSVANYDQMESNTHRVRTIDTGYFGLDADSTQQQDNRYDYEPSLGQLLSHMDKNHLPYWVELCYLDSKTAEFSARLLAMDRANNNAGDIIKISKLLYNRIRQQNVTRELIEIISAAELVHAQ